MKTITLENAEFDLLTNLLVDHLEEISEDEFFHSTSHNEFVNNINDVNVVDNNINVITPTTP